MVLLTLDFIIYLVSIFYVFNSAWKTLDWTKVSPISMLILIFPLVHFALEAICRFWVYKITPRANIGFIYYNSSVLGCLVRVAGIFNSMCINVFLLRVFKVAAILKCESRQEEIKTDKNISLFIKIYCPAYFFCQVGIYSC